MIKFDNKTISSIYYSGHSISRIMGCDGHLVWSGGTTPTGDKIIVIYKDNPSGLTEYTYACDGNSTLLPNDKREIDNDTTLDSYITDVVIGNCVTEIGSGALGDCDGLKSLSSVTIPNSVTSIGTYAFWVCTSLSSLTIPNSVTSIDHNAFNGCSGLTSLTIPNSVTYLGGNAFQDCKSLQSVELSSNMTSIENRTFWNCTSLTSITIPSSITYIGNYAFLDCRSLTSITCLSTTPPTLGTNVFSGTTCSIYVPSASVNTYKTASRWSNYANRIYPIP